MLIIEVSAGMIPESVSFDSWTCWAIGDKFAVAEIANFLALTWVISDVRVFAIFGRGTGVLDRALVRSENRRSRADLRSSGTIVAARVLCASSSASDGKWHKEIGRPGGDKVSGTEADASVSTCSKMGTVPCNF